MQNMTAVYKFGLKMHQYNKGMYMCGKLTRSQPSHAPP